MKFRTAFGCGVLLLIALQTHNIQAIEDGDGVGKGNDIGVDAVLPTVSVNSVVRDILEHDNALNEVLQSNLSRYDADEGVVTEERKTFYHLDKTQRVQIVQQCMSRFSNATVHAMLELIDVADGEVVRIAQKVIAAAHAAIETVQSAADDLRAKRMASVRRFRSEKRDEWYEWETKQYDRVDRVHWKTDDKRKRSLRTPISQMLSEFHKKLDACGDEIDDELHDLNLRIQAGVSALQPAINELEAFIEPFVKRGHKGKRVALDAERAQDLLRNVEERTQVLPPLLNVVELRDGTDFQKRSCYELMLAEMDKAQKEFEKRIDELIASAR